MEEGVKVEKLEPRIKETKLWNLHNLPWAFLIGIGLIIAVVALIYYFNLDLALALITMWVVTVIYAAILFFLLEPRILRQIEQTVLHTIEKPVFRDVEVEKEVVREVPVEKKVYVDRPVVRNVYVPSARKKLNIPKYNFVGSIQTKTYHKRNCRLGKLIKKKYKLSNNSRNFFIKKKFKPCKVCITKQKKV